MSTEDETTPAADERSPAIAASAPAGDSPDVPLADASTTNGEVPRASEPTPPSEEAATSEAAAETPLSVAEHAALPVAEHAALPVDPASDASAAPAEANEARDEATPAPAAEGEAQAAGGSTPPAGKKKRRRKRKKKSNAPDGERASARPPARPPERPPFQVGEEVFGKVTAVLETAVMLDLSGKALGIFDRTEMEPDDLLPEVGDRFLGRVHNDGGRGGLVVLTRKPLREEEAKPIVEAAAKSGEHVEGLVTGSIRGGVEVDINGLRAFAPASGMDLHPANANFAGLVGTRLPFKVIQYEKQGRDVVVTRRPMLEQEAHARRKQALEVLQEGSEMEGVVRTVVDWGAFLALPEAENLEGLLHVSEASHDPRTPLAELVKPGDRFPVKITKIDEKGKIWLSRKALISDPWADAREKLPTGTKLAGKVTRLEKFGVFVEVDDGIDGLIHITDLSFNRIEHPSELLKVGDDINVVVHHFDLRHRKIALHPALENDEPVQKIARNAHVTAEVIKADTKGVEMRILGVTGRAARGFLPPGQTGTQRGTDLRKVFKAGQQLQVKVIDIDPRRGEPKLSLRAHAEDEERRAHRDYQKKLKSEAKFGTLGDLLKQKLGM